MRVEGDEALLPHLGYFEVAQLLPGEVLVNEAAVAEANRFPRDLPLEIALEVDIHGPYHGQRDPAHHAPGRAVIQKPLLHPSGVAELLCHASWPSVPTVPTVGDPACAATPALSCPTHSVNSATRINPLPSHPPWSSCSPRKYQASQAAKAGSSEKMGATRCAGTMLWAHICTANAPVARTPVTINATISTAVGVNQTVSGDSMTIARNMARATKTNYHPNKQTASHHGEE